MLTWLVFAQTITFMHNIGSVIIVIANALQKLTLHFYILICYSIRLINNYNFDFMSIMSLVCMFNLLPGTIYLHIFNLTTLRITACKSTSTTTCRLLSNTACRGTSTTICRPLSTAASRNKSTTTCRLLSTTAYRSKSTTTCRLISTAACSSTSTTACGLLFAAACRSITTSTFR